MAMAPTVAALTAAAWARCRRREAKKKVHKALDAAEVEVQYELVATGLTVDDNQVLSLFAQARSHDEAQTVAALLTPLPSDQQDADYADRYHFRLVVAVTLLAQFFELQGSKEDAKRLLCGSLGREVLLPLLEHAHHAALHHASLGMLQILLSAIEKDEATATELFTLVSELLMQEGQLASVEGDDEKVDANARELSYASLCSLLELLILQQESETMVGLTVELCACAVSRWARQPKFLRAVSSQLVPAVLRVSSTTSNAVVIAERLLELTLDAWDAHDGTVSPRELLYLVCMLMPQEPQVLIANTRLQQLVCAALRHSDALLRKQGLHILKVAFSHCAVLLGGKEESTDRFVKGKKTKKSNETAPASLQPWVSKWQSFLTASEVIQMHHEQHLIEQVWPQVAALLGNSLVVLSDQQRDEDRDQVTPSWPVKLTFEWLESLLVRVFAHDNPVVKRLFLSNFMEVCTEAWSAWEAQSGVKTVDVTASFSCSSIFQRFVLVHVLRACNDPMLFKSSHRVRFQTLLVDFLASYLAFQLQHPQGSDKRVLDRYVAAMEEAVFGLDAESHSPDALLGMLQVFQAHKLIQSVAKADSATTTAELSAAAVDRLRFLVDVHVLKSFSQGMRVKMLRALAYALTGGFTRPSQLSLSALARVLGVFPMSSLLMNDGEALTRVMAWLDGWKHMEGSSHSFQTALADALRVYLTMRSDGNEATECLSAVQLAQLLIFTAEEITTIQGDLSKTASDRSTSKPFAVALRSPLSDLIVRVPSNQLNGKRLVQLIARLEEKLQGLVTSSSSSTCSQPFTFIFDAKSFYAGGDNTTFSCSMLFDRAMMIIRAWLKQAEVSSTLGRDASAGDQDREETMELVGSAAFVLTQMAIHTMDMSGELREMDALGVLCKDIKALLGRADCAVHNLALAATCLCTISSSTKVVDSLSAFDSARTLPVLLALDTSKRFSGRLDARCAVSLAASKWVLLHHVLQASAFTSSALLRSTHDACVRALPTAGMDPLALLEMVQVLSLTLTQLAAPLVHDDLERVEELLEEIWSAYSDSKPKPDALTRAVVSCIFQPAFLVSGTFRRTMKRWLAEFLRFGARNRPNVVFHLTCRLCQVWRAHPRAAVGFADEIMALLLYKEPIIDEKEQIKTEVGDAGKSSSSAPFQGFQSFSPDSEAQTSAIVSGAKDRFVRLIVLSFLADLSVEKSTTDSGTQQLVDALLGQLMALNASPDWQKQHMLNSDGFGKKLRSWQTLCVISAQASKSSLVALLPTLQTAFAVPQLPCVRYYMELFGMRLAVRLPRELCSEFLLPMLRDVNLMPQVGASLLLVATYLVHHRLDAGLDDDGELLETMMPWLNTSHGYTRVLAQYLLAKLLPRHVHHLQSKGTSSPGLRFLEGTARFLSDNKESKRMLRRQARQLEEFQPEYESSLLGLLTSGSVSEFGELLPRDEVLRFSEQLKTAMNELYGQFQRENFPEYESADASNSSANSSEPSGSLTVQRKIDTSALLLEDNVLPAVMRADFDATNRGDALNARRRPRQPIIMCASLVDKVPNLAGLARTCEIFNAQALVVPNVRVAQQDATFAAVSATASKWMPLEEVRPQGDDLRLALRRWKREGYTIVAVEQTASSVSLATCRLPRKMVVVLGREKEGIPVDVLQLVDLCVEIPQFGLIRSLNVHVSGALLLWEYTQQQLIAGAVEAGN